MDAIDLLICCAAPLEAAALIDRLGGRAGRLGGRAIEVAITGIGPVNAAFAAATTPARTIIVCGVGGAYPGSDLEIGDVVCATTETWADLGVEDEWDVTAMGFETAPGFGNTLPLDVFPAARRAAFVTSSTCTATERRAHELALRTGGAVESMEGAAVVQIARHRNLAVGEIRGISNTVGKRDRASWRLREAAEIAQRTLITWIEDNPTC